MPPFSSSPQSSFFVLASNRKTVSSRAVHIIMKLIFISRRPEPLTRVHAGHLGSYETQTLTLWVWVEPQLPREVHVVHGQGPSCDRHWAWKRT